MIGPNQRPSPALRVGVVGHTASLPEDELRKTFDRLLDEIAAHAHAAVAQGTGYETAPCRFSLISCLAPGTDQIAAKQARARGFRLTCVLPDTREAYRARLAHRPGSGASGLDDLLDAQPAPVVVQLAQSSMSGAEADLESTRLVVEHADLLIAVWSGAKADALSYTTFAVHAALHRGLTVIWIDPASSDRWCILESARAGQLPQASAATLQARINAVLADPFPPARDGNDSAHGHAGESEPPRLYRRGGAARRQLDLDADQDRKRTRFYHEPDEAPGSFSEFWNWAFYGPAVAEQQAQKAAFDAASPGPPEDGGAVRLSECSAHDLAGFSAYDAHYARADKLADRFMNLYRSAFSACYLLGGLAVLLAVLACVRLGGSPLPPMIFALLELITVGVIYRIYRRAVSQQWRVRAVEYRLLAEMFRHARMLALVGGALPEVNLPHHWTGRGPSPGGGGGRWMHWYFRAVARDLDFGLPATAPPLVFDQPRVERGRRLLRNAWLDDQQGFHARGSRRYRFLEWKLERLGDLLFIAVALACGLHLALEIAAFVGPRGHGESPHHAGLLDLALLIIGAAAPAFAAALHAIKTQAETARLAESYERMELALDQVKARLDAIPTPTPLDDLTRVASDAADIMLAEVEDWQTAYRFHEVTAA